MPFGVSGTRFKGFSQSGTFSGNVTKLSQDMGYYRKTDS